MSLGPPPRSNFKDWYAEHEERGESLTGEELARAAWNAAIAAAATQPPHYTFDEKTAAGFNRGFGVDGAKKALASVWSFHQSLIRLLAEREPHKRHE